jgi:hypothetical protein
VAALGLGEGWIVLKAPADRFLIGHSALSPVLPLLLALSVGAEKPLGPVAGSSAATSVVAPKPSSSATVSGNTVFMASLLACSAVTFIAYGEWSQPLPRLIQLLPCLISLAPDWHGMSQPTRN